MIEAASEVKALPMVETSCPVHIKEKFLWRKTKKGDGCLVATAVVPGVIMILL
jgi:hypothetical protein